MDYASSFRYKSLCRSNCYIMWLCCTYCSIVVGYREFSRIYHRVCYIVGGGIYKGLTELLPQVWFYEHTTIFSNQDEE